MKLQDFQFHVDRIIVDRGYDYYSNGFVTPKGSKGAAYRFQVSGSDEYEVIITLNPEGEIVSSYCNCPYDYGPVCKHETAAYFELMDESDEELDGSTGFQGAPNLVEVLDGLRKDQLVSILVELAEEDEILESRLRMTYSDDAGKADMQNWIRSIVNKYMGRAGYIEYHDTNEFVSELGECLVRIEDDADGIGALEQAFELLEEAISAFQYADDSGGDVGCLVEDTLATIETVASDAVLFKPDHRQEVFDKLLSRSEHSMFEGWNEYQIAMLKICADVADSPEQIESVRRKVTSMIDETSTDYYRRYRSEELSRVLFTMIEKDGSEIEADMFIRNHLQYPSFREQLIHKYLAKKQFDEVIQLASEGEQADKNLPGLVQKWKRFRYSGYKALSMEAEQFSLAKELFMDGDFAFYQDLKELAADPEQLYNQLKQDVQKGSGWKAISLFQSLIKKENDLSEMLMFVQKNPGYIEEYADKLIGSYEDEIRKNYKESIESAACRASNRKGYQSVCQMIRRYGKLVGKQHEQVIVEGLRHDYRRKPAFMDELSKL